MKLEKRHENNKFVADAANNNFRHVGTLKYMNLLLHIDIHLQRVKYIINEQSMNINVFLFCSFVFLQIEGERGGVYKIGYKEKRSQSLLVFFLWWSSCGEYFLFYGLIDFILFLILAWRIGSFMSKILFVFFYPEYLAFGSRPPRTLSNNWFFLFFFRWREEGPISVFRVPANHLVSTFFLPVSGDPREVTEYKHLFLTVILWRLATVNSNTRIVEILFLSSQWEDHVTKWTATAGIKIHLTEPWLSQLLNYKNAI